MTEDASGVAELVGIHLLLILSCGMRKIIITKTCSIKDGESLHFIIHQLNSRNVRLSSKASTQKAKVGSAVRHIDFLSQKTELVYF